MTLERGQPFIHFVSHCHKFSPISIGLQSYPRQVGACVVWCAVMWGGKVWCAVMWGGKVWCAVMWGGKVWCAVM